MAFPHEPLTVGQLGPIVAKMVCDTAPTAVRAMVSRGLAPLAPRDLVVGLYQLWVTNEAPFAEQSAKTVASLPGPVFEGAIGDPAMHPGVLDLLARKLIRNGDLLDKLVRHANVSTPTLIGVARVCPEVVCDTLADNQDRWLQCPAIVESLYRNPKTKMSVVQHMLELAEREHLKLNLPGMEEIRVLLRTESIDANRDHVFARSMQSHDGALEARRDRLALAGVEDDVDSEYTPEEASTYSAVRGTTDMLRDAAPTETEDWQDLASPELLPDDFALPTSGANVDNDDGAAEAGNAVVGGDLGVEKRAVTVPGQDDIGTFSADAARDSASRAENVDSQPAARENRLSQLLQMRPLEKIRVALMGDQFDRSILVRDSNKMVAMATIKSPKIRDDEAVAYSSNRSLSHDVIRYIAVRREWVRLYAIKFNLVMNPKTPLSRAMGLLPHLHAGDVRKVARSKNISSALAKAAKRRGQVRR
ncbi:MAG: hypothetical protein V3V08_14190 [Nannocystaceae bacterium]